MLRSLAPEKANMNNDTISLLPPAVHHKHDLAPLEFHQQAGSCFDRRLLRDIRDMIKIGLLKREEVLLATSWFCEREYTTHHMIAMR